MGSRKQRHGDNAHPRPAERSCSPPIYPLFSYHRLFAGWRRLGCAEAVFERIFHGNAEALLAHLGRA